MSSYYYFVISGTDTNGVRFYLTSRVDIPFLGLRDLPEDKTLLEAAVSNAMNKGLFSADHFYAQYYCYEAATKRPLKALARLSEVTGISGFQVEVRTRKLFSTSVPLLKHSSSGIMDS